ncbi:hypothetical protein ACFS5N_16230 [Mucilaginibacter ximonensis]|uniref:Uncharacterized protein n=1 Tax=Mucilaginibacter ximonensis TaxID=538021 RepID=A0ABW5YFI8_9SPHI
MKRLLKTLIMICLPALVLAQAKPDYKRTLTRQVVSDMASKAQEFLAIPKAIGVIKPSYVPDSNWAAGILLNTAEQALYIGGNKYADTVKKIALTQKGATNGVATLDGGGKVPLSQLPANLLVYKGQWNPATNTPTLVNGTGTSGDVWEASADGDHNFGSGTLHFLQGDFVIYNGSAWQLSAGTNRVTSVNGYQGIVNLNTDDVGEGSTNKYYTQARVQAWSDLAYAPISGSANYLNLTGSTQTIGQSPNITGILSFTNITATAGNGQQGFRFLNGDGTTYSRIFYHKDNHELHIEAPIIGSAFETSTSYISDYGVGTSNLGITHSTYGVQITAPSLTNNRSQTIQDKNGVFAYLDDIPSNYVTTNTTQTGLTGDKTSAGNRYYINPTLATSSVQQPSPTIESGGQGWSTSGAGSSQYVSFFVKTVPVSSASLSTSYFSWNSNINGTITNDIMKLTPAGGLTITSTFNAASTITAPRITLNTGNIQTTPTDAVALSNASTATLAIPIQYSTAIRWDASAYNPILSTANSINWRLDVRPTSSNPVTSLWTLSTQLNAGGYSTVFTVDNSGNTISSGYLKVTQLRISALNAAPTSSSDTGTTGEIRYTSNGIFWCIATNSWIKVTGSTF